MNKHPADVLADELTRDGCAYCCVRGATMLRTIPALERARDALRAELAALKAQAAQPVAWMDDFGNAFPLAANKGAGSWLDDHKRTWKPLYTAPQAAQPNWDALRHAANEWADMATNGLQWVRNINDGISTPAVALENLAQCLAHCQKVNDAVRWPARATRSGHDQGR